MGTSTNQVSWDRHFQPALSKHSSGHICTGVKKKGGTPIYTEEGIKTNDTVARSTMVRVVEQIYPTTPPTANKILAKVKQGARWKNVRININDLEKPGVSSGAPLLKPQEFGLVETREYSFDQARDQILDSLDDRTDLPGTVKQYLKMLLLFESEGNTIKPEEVTRAFQGMKDGEVKKWANDIVKDYGETIGPFACYGRNLINDVSNGRYTMSKSAKIWWPEDPAEPLLDYGLRLTASDKSMMLISAKALSLFGKGIKGNTVKAQDIITLLERHEPKNGRKRVDLKDKWRRKLQYGILQDIIAHSSWSGPAVAVRRMIKAGAVPPRKYPGFTDEAVKDLVQNEKNFSRAKWKTFEDTSPVIAGRRKEKGRQWPGMSAENLRYASEKILMKECMPNSRTSFAQIFGDAIMNRVIYIKFGLAATTGLPLWKAKAAADYRDMDKICFRSTNQFDSGKGKIGLDTT